MSTIQHEFHSSDSLHVALVLGSGHGFQAGTPKVVQSVATIIGNPVVVHMKGVACSVGWMQVLRFTPRSGLPRFTLRM